MILDGFGISFFQEGNAVLAAQMTNLQNYLRTYPCAAIRAAGIEVGLPWGEVGNSEVGHKNIGSGRVIYQPLPQITLAIQDRTFFQNVAFQEASAHVKERPGSVLHLMGCVSPGGVHSHLQHLLALLEFAAQQGIGKQTFIHAFLDGRDAPPVSAGQYLVDVDKTIRRTGAGRIATLIGRYYAMDRNNNWDRTRAAYDLLVSGTGTPYRSWQEALEAAYESRKTDEIVPPSVITDNGPVRTIRDGDAILFFNFRPDRARQLTHAFVAKNFGRFKAVPFADLAFITMAEYEKGLPVTVAFPEEWMDMPVGRVIADHGLRQLRVAETEKYAHVTYYFNSGRELPFPNEDRILVPSPNVKEYVETPRMSAEAITDQVVGEIAKGKYDVIVMNYANPDMLGHTGNFEAAVEALRFLDTQLPRVVSAALSAGGAVLLTCDHGNAEEMRNPQTGAVVTDHSVNPVPLAYLASQNQQNPPKTDEALFRILGTPIGVLADVGPTVVEILGLPKPPEMTAQSLLASLL
ncbi:MAG: 2,3-bisphosphoglycerate-independent phosphoglycerate mutase [Parcubacteria group bacterium Gr01-1014_38]|nr:MAG: 2,3-bisphosphoglycerate-independent phosphoglycerate mutase [Parcubacteria group bacterium Gr01-1014_38]